MFYVRTRFVTIIFNWLSTVSIMPIIQKMFPLEFLSKYFVCLLIFLLCRMFATSLCSLALIQEGRGIMLNKLGSLTPNIFHPFVIFDELCKLPALMSVNGWVVGYLSSPAEVCSSKFCLLGSSTKKFPPEKD